MVSIIIPTYNRGRFIQETLHSIWEQSYREWECIIIDDGSWDNTETIVEEYIKDKDKFTFIKRPSHIKKGANACRNFGFSISQGEYIKFFDSDDLMIFNHLECLVSYIERLELDFVVGDIINFDATGFKERPYEIDRDNVQISVLNFAKHIVAWCTVDCLLKRNLASQIKFNENIRDVANEYQYYLKLLLLTTNGRLVKEIITYRRLHIDSMTVNLKQSELGFDEHIAELKYETMKYLEGISPEFLQKWLLEGFVQYCYSIANKGRWPKFVFSSYGYTIKYFGFFKASLFPIAIILVKTTGKGYSLLKFIRT